MTRPPATLATLLARAQASGTLLTSGCLPELRDAGVAVSVELREVDAVGNGTTYSGDAGAAMGHPLTALRWLVEALARDGQALRAGEVVMTGGLTPTVPLSAGSTVTARFDSPGWTGQARVTR